MQQEDREKKWYRVNREKREERGEVRMRRVDYEV
jgi:hypothetical protein